MDPLSGLPWTKIHEFLLDVGSVREPRDFGVRLIQRICRLIPYDQARVYFVTDNGKIYDEFLIGVEPRWSHIYREYYSRIENGRYAIPTRRYAIPTRAENGRYAIPRVEGAVYDWNDYEPDEFVSGYIKPQRIHHTAGFALHTSADLVRSVYCLDRTGRNGYSQREIEIISVVLPHLDNLHKNLFVLASKNRPVQNLKAQQFLTRRESEIADLLCRGLTPAKISNHLCVSLATVYRHLANMHTKLNVSNRQELLLKLLEDQENHYFS